MRRTRIAVAALVVVAGSVIGLAPAANALPRKVDICTGPIEELDEHLKSDRLLLDQLRRHVLPLPLLTRS